MLYSLREATDADRAWLDALRRAVYAKLPHATWGGWDEARHQRHFEASWERGHMRLVEVDGRPIGMIQLHEFDDCVAVGEIQVLPEYQNKGLGTRLLVDVIDRARQRGRDVELPTGLRGAYRLFRCLGFAETRRSDTHIHLLPHRHPMTREPRTRRDVRRGTARTRDAWRLDRGAGRTSGRLRWKSARATD